MSSRIEIPPSVKCVLKIVSIALLAAAALSWETSIGVMRAIGSPRRVIVIVSPDSTSPINAEKCVLASKIPTVFT